MTTGPTPSWRINEIIAQMGGMGMRGALGYIGASQFVYRDRPDYATPAASAVDEKSGTVSFETGLMFSVNGKPQNWKMVVTLEPSDTYTVRLFRMRRPNKDNQQAIVLDVETGVYCDQLQSTVESMYDGAIQRHYDGAITLG